MTSGGGGSGSSNAITVVNLVVSVRIVQPLRWAQVAFLAILFALGARGPRVVMAEFVYQRKSAPIKHRSLIRERHVERFRGVQVARGKCPFNCLFHVPFFHSP